MDVQILDRLYLISRAKVIYEELICQICEKCEFHKEKHVEQVAWIIR